MAAEITFAGIEGEYAHDYLIDFENILNAFYANDVVSDTFLTVDISGWSTDSARFPVAPKLAAAALVDGTAVGNTAYSPNQATIAVSEVGIMLTPTDLNLNSSGFGLDRYSFDAGQAVAEKLVTDCCALLPGLNTQVGTTNVNLTETNFTDAILTLEALDVRAPYAAILHPRQYWDLIADMGTTFTVGTGETARASTNDLAAADAAGRRGELFGVDVRTTSAVPSVAAGADRGGAVFAKNRTFGLVWKSRLGVEMMRQAPLRGTNIVCVSTYGVGELDDASGVEIATDL